MSNTIEYTVRPGDTWSGLAGRLLNDQRRYPELLALNQLEPGAGLYVGQKLRIPVEERGNESLSPDIILGEGATQIVDAALVTGLQRKWIDEGKLAAGADRADVLRAFLKDLEHWDAGGPAVVDYLVQAGDSWAGIAGKFLGDQTRYPEIMTFNGLPPGTPLRLGQRIRIPPR